MIKIKLYEKLPKGVTANGRFYKCDFDFRNVLKMLDIMQRDDIYITARDYLCAKCLISRKMTLKTASGVYKALCDLLFEKPEKTGEKPLTSWEQDAGLIRAAFRQVYGINLYTDRLTWFEFIELLHALPDGNRYEEVIGIRARPIPAANKYNAKEREWLIKAKRAVAIEISDEDKAEQYEKNVGRVFDVLFAYYSNKEVKK